MKTTVLSGRYSATALSDYKDTKRQPVYSTPQARDQAKRQLALLDAIAAEPGKESRHYATAIGVNLNIVNHDLRVLYDDGIVKPYSPPDKEKIWYIKPLKQDLKPCTLN